MVIGYLAPNPRVQTPAKQPPFGFDRVFGHNGVSVIDDPVDTSNSVSLPAPRVDGPSPLSRIAIIPNIVDGGVYEILETSVIHGPHEVQRIAGGRREDERDILKRAGVEHWRPAPAVNEPTVAKCAGVKLLIV
jgi:hypothetical protein